MGEWSIDVPRNNLARAEVYGSNRSGSWHEHSCLDLGREKIFGLDVIKRLDRGNELSRLNNLKFRDLGLHAIKTGGRLWRELKSRRLRITHSHLLMSERSYGDDQDKSYRQPVACNP